MMKKIFLFLFLAAGYFAIPLYTFAQGTQKAKASIKAKPAEGFVINATVTGFPEGTVVELLNGQTGETETATVLKENKFEFKGKLERPDFKIILFNKQPPFITLFIDNSNIKITGVKDSISKAKVTGSKAHLAFEEFNNSLEPFKDVFNENAEYNAAATETAMKLISDFVNKHSNSYITPLAVIRFDQIAEDPLKTELLYNLLAPEIRASSMGVYIAQLIADAKNNGAGTLLPDFSQPDTAGISVSLSSLRGKYVLVDFWASWCAPCRQENPNLVAAYNKYKTKNFTVLGVSLDKTKQAWIDAIKMDALTWTHVSDLRGWSNSVAQQFQISSIPQNFLIDPDGKVVGKNLRGPALERKLARILR